MNCITTTTRDLKNIVECHKSAFPNALSSKMGNTFISKMIMLYKFNFLILTTKINNSTNFLIYKLKTHHK